QFQQILVELMEAAPPQRALLRHPALGRLQRLGHEPIGTHAADLARADEARLFENVEMLRERRKRHVEGARQLAHGGGAGAEPAQHGAPRGIAQRAKDPVELRLLVRHMPNHSAKPILRSMPKRMARAEDERRLAKDAMTAAHQRLPYGCGPEWRSSRSARNTLL